MQPIYAVFNQASATSVAGVQNVIDGVPVQMVRSNANLNLPGNNQYFSLGMFARPLVITLSAALTSIGTITILGNNYGGPITEIISTLASGANNSVNAYTNISSITFNLLPGQSLPTSPVTTISVGTGATGAALVTLDTFSYYQQVSVAANITSGTMTYTVSQTLDNTIFPNSNTQNQVPIGAEFFEPLASMTAATTSKIATQSDIKIPISALLIDVTASTGSAVFTVLQQGAAFR